MNPAAPSWRRPWQGLDGASLAAFRVALGAVLAWDGVQHLLSNELARVYVDPPFHFSWPGLESIRPLSLPGMQALCAGLTACAISLALGLASRASALLLALGWGYLFALEQARYLNHVYLLLLVLGIMACAPSGATLSWTVWRGRRRARSIPALPLLLLRTLTGMVYAFAALAKLDGDWLSGAPLTDWLAQRSDHAVLGPLLMLPHAGLAFAWAGLAIDALAWPLLSWRRTRGSMFTFLLAFHLTNATLFQIGIFPWLSMALASLFLDPEWPRRSLKRMAEGDRDAALLPRRPRLVLALAVLFLAIQLALPLRQHLYPGDVAWSENGHRFSWRMKLRDKDGEAVFRVTDRATGEVLLVDPRTQVTDWQYGKMVGRPDMLAAFARHLSRQASGDGRSVSVAVISRCSLNGRPPQALVDPAVDLGASSWSLLPQPWILPGPRDGP